MRKIRHFRFGKKSVIKAVRMFSLSVGATAVCMLSALGVLSPQNADVGVAVEASIFNGEGAKTATMPTESITKKVVPLGTVFGIKLFTDGVIVASLSDVYTEHGMCCPAADAGIKAGDYILEANGETVLNNAAAASIIGSSEGKSITLKVRRGEMVFETEVSPVYAENSFKTGMWIRDSAAGIGTLTYYDPSSGTFAGLGHGICDMDTNGVMTLKSGQPAPITLCGIEKGKPDSPGQLKGYFSSEENMGTLFSNSETGVYGTLNEVPNGAAVEILHRDEVKCGDAEVLVTLDDSGSKSYTAEIIEISHESRPTRNFIIKVTDPKLLELTGGIVQGMGVRYNRDNTGNP